MKKIISLAACLAIVAGALIWKSSTSNTVQTVSEQAQITEPSQSVAEPQVQPEASQTAKTNVFVATGNGVDAKFE
jgi:hypothetical protein